MSKVNAKGRSKNDHHVRLYSWLTNSLAWRHASGNEVKALIYIATFDFGDNNGRLHMSERRLAEGILVDRKTARKLLRSLGEKGFIECTSKGSFNAKCSPASEWRLTWRSWPDRGQGPTHNYRSWRPKEKSRGSSFPSRGGEITTVRGSRSGTGELITPGQTAKAQKSAIPFVGISGPLTLPVQRRRRVSVKTECVTEMAASGKKNAKRPMVVEAIKGETQEQSMSRVMVEPYVRHGAVTSALSDKMIGTLPGEPNFSDFGQALKLSGQKAAGAELKFASELLIVQAQTLDAIFTECARRATINLGEYVNASERYMRLALKAQAGSRATLEAMIRLHAPKEQTVKHMHQHVGSGGQAIMADQIHNHGGSKEIGISNEQSHAPTSAGTASGGAALPSPDPARNGVPIPSSEGQEKVPNARRD